MIRVFFDCFFFFWGKRVVLIVFGVSSRSSRRGGEWVGRATTELEESVSISILVVLFINEWFWVGGFIGYVLVFLFVKWGKN